MRRKRSGRRSYSQRVFASIISQHERQKDFEQRRAAQGRAASEIVASVPPPRDAAQIARAASAALRESVA